jgi:hypothetical protein
MSSLSLRRGCRIQCLRYRLVSNYFCSKGEGGGRGRKNPLVEVTVNSKEENSYDFCPNYVQEFVLRLYLYSRNDLHHKVVLKIFVYVFYILHIYTDTHQDFLSAASYLLFCCKQGSLDAAVHCAVHTFCNTHKFAIYSRSANIICMHRYIEEGGAVPSNQ